MIFRYNKGAHKDETNAFIRSERMDQLSKMSAQDANPIQVAEVMHDALYSERPNARYFVGNAKEAHVMIEGILTKMLQINQNPHKKTRDELVDLLDDLLNIFDTPKPYRFI